MMKLRTALLRLYLPVGLCWVALPFDVAGQVVISEFMAANTRTLVDDEGDSSDWIELYNSGRASVSLAGWHLTDSATNLTRWRFPEVILEANGHLIVFASGKNRALPSGPLHTNFRLNSSGDFLALVKPDGSIASSYAPAYPVQAGDISYGIPLQQTVVPLLTRGAPGKMLVPSNDALGAGWTDPEWNDVSWLAVTNGIGFDAGGRYRTIAALVADSVAEFSGTQGQDGWFYGSYHRTGDRVAGYQPEDFLPFPRQEGGHGVSNFWTGGAWDWYAGDPPWIEIGSSFTRPNGSNSGGEQWAIRRWVSAAAGTLQVTWALRKQDPNGSGVTGRVLHNGAQKDIAIIDGNDVTGVTRSLILTNVSVGDFIDFALAAAGTRNTTDDIADGSFFTAKISSVGGLASQIRSDVEAAVRNKNASAYLRFPFTVADASKFEFLTLRVRYNDGFIAYLNGVEVARRNAPDAAAWSSAAAAERDPAEVAKWEEINLARSLGLLHVGQNVLAVQALNSSASDPDFLWVADLRATISTMDLSAQRYFALPTPGTLNGFGKTNLGPLILDVRHTPPIPSDDEDLVVTARLASTFDALKAAELRYRVMFSNEVSVPMLDDGQHGDGAAGDGVFGGKIPAQASSRGQMVRYAVLATDATGDISRWPLYPDPRNSPQYLGTVVSDPSIATALPVLHWFIQSPNAANTETGTRAAVFFDGEFYDNIAVTLHGQSSEGFPKKSYDFDFNRGHHFRYDRKERRVEDFNLLTTYPDKAHVRNILAYETYRDAGSPYHIAFPIRVQQNGAFYSHAHWVEDGDEDYLERVGLDPRGALYKMYNTLDSATSGAEKKTRKFENNADLQALIAGLRRTGAARTQFIYDNINVPAMVNYLAAMIVTGGIDCCHKNYYAYRDSEGTGEWQYLPWDQDLTFGRNWTSAQTYYDDTMYTDNGLYVGSNNTLGLALFATPTIKQMYLRRLRTLMDELLQNTNTPPAELKYERRIHELSTLIAPDVSLDFAKWPTWGQRQTLAQALDILTNRYLPARRRFLYRHREVPAAQPANAAVLFSDVEFNPSSGNQDEEYVRLINTNSFAVDLSGWKLAGAISYTFRPGVVLPTNGSVYVSPHVVSFRARPAAPRGGQGLFVQGNYRGRLSARGDTLRLLDAAGREVAAHTYAGNPTPAQRYLRITEIMYHPLPPPAGSPFSDEDFEYIKLKNLGDVTLDLRGVRFTRGIQFLFPINQPSYLAPGDSIFVVKNRAAFVSRYGFALPIAGEYTGSLNNGGERVEILDAMGESVLDFDFDPAWYATTDGQGFSLAILNEMAAPNTWWSKESWRASSIAGGSAALGDTAYQAWKSQHFAPAEQSNATISGDAADPDGDGYTNRQEFMAGTNPRDRLEHLRLGVAQSGGAAGRDVKIRFNAASGKSYTVQYSDRLV